MNVNNEDEYDRALEKVYLLMQTHPATDSLEGRNLDKLVTFIERYEAIHYPMIKSKQTK